MRAFRFVVNLVCLYVFLILIIPGFPIILMIDLFTESNPKLKLLTQMSNDYWWKQ